MRKVSKKFFNNTELDDDDVGLREALLREMGPGENSEKLRKKEIHLKSYRKGSIGPDKKHSDIPVNGGEDGKANSIDLNLPENIGSTPTALNDLHSFDIAPLRRKEAELEAELRAVQHLIQMVGRPGGLPASSELTSLRSEIKSIKDLLNEQTDLLCSIKKTMMAISKREKQAGRKDKK